MPLLQGHCCLQSNYCNLFGRVFIEQKAHLAQYKVFVQESEHLADVLIYKQDNSLYADKQGNWFMTDEKSYADIIIYITKNQSEADFSIYYTDTESFAGCQ